MSSKFLWIGKNFLPVTVTARQPLPNKLKPIDDEILSHSYCWLNSNKMHSKHIIHNLHKYIYFHLQDFFNCMKFSILLYILSANSNGCTNLLFIFYYLEIKITKENTEVSKPSNPKKCTKSDQRNRKQITNFNKYRKKSKRNESFCCYQDKPKILLQIRKKQLNDQSRNWTSPG